MIKQVAIFAVSSGILVYFIAPVSKEEAPAPVAAKVQPPAAVEDDDSEWEADGNGETEEEFVFGEPMMSTEIDESYDEDGTATSSIASGASTKNQFVKQKKALTFKRSPKGNELGSKNNPINLTPSTPRS